MTKRRDLCPRCELWYVDEETLCPACQDEGVSGLYVALTWLAIVVGCLAFWIIAVPWFVGWLFPLELFS